MNQTEQLLDHLIKTGNISNVEAQALYKMRALPRRIADLKDQGIDIRSEWRRDVTGQRYKRYLLPLSERRRLRLQHRVAA